jgi:hypothetical protein
LLRLECGQFNDYVLLLLTLVFALFSDDCGISKFVVDV